MMQTRNLGITMDQGSDFNLVIGIYDALGPIDISDYQFLSQMRKSTDPSVMSPVAEFTFTILNQTTNKGQVAWSLPKETIDAIVTSIATPLDPSRQLTPFLYDVKMKDNLGKVSRIIQGLIEVSPEATLESFT